MKTIEEEIKQKKFPDIYVKTDVNLLFTLSWLQNKNTRFFKPFGVSIQQFNVLRILRGQHPNAVMLNQISERMIDKMSNATRLVEKLKLKNYVTRELNPNNRRQVDIHITKEGLILLDTIDKAIASVTPPKHYNKFTKKELELLNSFLDRIRN